MLTPSNNKNKALFIGWIVLFASVSFLIVWFHETMQTWLVVLAGIVVGVLLEWMSLKSTMYDVPDATHVWHRKPLKGPRLLGLSFVLFYFIQSIARHGITYPPSIFLAVFSIVSLVAFLLLNKQQHPVRFYVRGPLLEFVGLWHMSRNLTTLKSMFLHGMTERLTLRFSNQPSIELSLKDVNDEGIRVLVQYCEEHTEHDLELSPNLQQYSSR